MMSVFLQKRYFQHDKSFQTCNTLRGTAVQKGSSSLPDCKEYSMYLSIDSWDMDLWLDHSFNSKNACPFTGRHLVKGF